MRQNIQDKLQEVIDLAKLEDNKAVQSILYALLGAMAIHDEEWLAAKIVPITMELLDRAIAGKQQIITQQN